MPKPSEYDKTHLRNMAAVGTRIDRIFKKATEEAAKIGVQIKSLHPDRIFCFDDYPQTKKQIERLMGALRTSTETAIANGVRSAWTLSNNKNDALARRVFGDRAASLTKEQARRYFTTNGAALDAFLSRREQGLNLSDRVWRYSDQFKEEIEFGLDLGIRSGKPAAEMARDLRKYLQKPDDMFRRFRYKVEDKPVLDKDGNPVIDKFTGKPMTEPVYGRKWKKRKVDAQGNVTWEDFDYAGYHPGRGVYKSAYKNARRLAVTETNMAYRTSDHLRWQQMDFVVGIRVVLSNNHTLNGEPFCDICDQLSAPLNFKEDEPRGKYPKDFKFVGWHPHCRCHVESILKTEEEMDQDTDRILAGEPTDTHSVNEVKQCNADFKDYIKQRGERIQAGGNLPYFVRDNRAMVDGILGLRKSVAQMAQERHRARTSEQIQSILDRWEARKKDPLVIAANRHAARTPEDIQRIQDAWNEKLKKDELIRKKASAVFKVAQDFETDIDGKTWLAMQEAIAKGNLTTMRRMTKPLGIEIKALQNRFKALKDADIIADLEDIHGVWSLTDLEGVQANVQRVFRRWTWNFEDNASLISLKDSLVHEVRWMETKGRKYATWEVARDAYQKKLGFVEARIQMLQIKTDIAAGIATLTASKSVVAKQLASEFSNLFADNKFDVSALQKKAAEIKTKAAQLEAARKRRAKASTPTPTPGTFIPKSDDETRKDFVDWCKKNGINITEKNVRVDHGFIHINEEMRGQMNTIYDALRPETRADHDQLWNHIQGGGLHGGRGGYVQTGNSFAINGIFRNKGLRGAIDASAEAALRTGGATADDIKTIKLLDKKISEFSMPIPLRATRYVRPSALTSIFGEAIQTNSDLNIPLADILRSAKKIQADPAFLSASLDEAANVFIQYQVKIEIEVPPNTPMYLTDNYAESEVIFGRGTALEFISAQIKPGVYSREQIVIRCRLKN